MRSKHNKGKLLPFQTQALTAFTLAVTATLVWAFTVQFGYATLKIGSH